MKRRTVFRGLLAGLGLIALLGGGTIAAWFLVPTPQVAVIRIEGDIWGFYTGYLSRAMEAAGRDRAVRAVVLEISSPGGEVTASEDLYYQVLKLRDIKPVVVSIGEIAASGGYYIAAAADEIYAKPGSTVGNIGVISVLPDEDVVDEKLITSGPFKLSGGTQVAAIRQIDMLKNTFLAAILSQRQDRLQVGPEVLSRGEVYLGLQAMQMGLVDEVGSLGDAITAAADKAGLRHYDVLDRSPELPEEYALPGLWGRRSTAATRTASGSDLPPGFYYRYVDPLQ